MRFVPFFTFVFIGFAFIASYVSYYMARAADQIIGTTSAYPIFAALAAWLIFLAIAAVTAYMEYNLHLQVENSLKSKDELFDRYPNIGCDSN